MKIKTDAKVHNVILFLVEQRLSARTQADWEIWNESALIVRDAQIPQPVTFPLDGQFANERFTGEND